MAEIRYTKGPDDLTLGDVPLVRGEWVKVDDAMADQADLPARKKEYGFEVRGRTKVQQQADAAVQTPAQ